MERSRVGIVIPAFNESATIESVVKAALNFGVPIVIDDGSIDQTAELARGAGAVVATHAHNCGYDCALNTGFKKAAELGLDIIVTVDADGQHDPSIIQTFVNMIDAGADVVVGVRGKRQRFSESFFASYTRIRFGIEDPLCGMKAYRRGVYDALGHFDSYGSVGTELMLFAATNRFRFSQTIINVRERKGQSRFGQMLSGNYKILRAMLFSLWRVTKADVPLQKA